MEFGSLLRSKSKKSQARRRTFSTSNLSCASSNSTVFGRKSIYITLPQNLEAETDTNGKVFSMIKGGVAHSSGVMQIGDYVQIVEKDEAEELISIRVTFGILQVEQRPTYPFVIEIGNRSQTSLGIALMDTPGNKIRISSILPGSLVDRCGYLRAGDVLTSIHISPNETMPCSPYYTSQHVAKMLRKVVQNCLSVVLTVFPDSTSSTNMSSCSGSYRTLLEDDNSSDISTLTLRNEQITPFLGDNHYDRDETHTELTCDNSKERTLTVCLWKDFLYEDWGFSLIDEENIDDDDGATEESRMVGWESERNGNRNGALVNEIRSGGSANLAGLKTGDKILRINGRNVSNLKSTILVPILASLEDALNLVILRG